MTPLYEKYRPRSWKELVGQPSIANRIEVMRQHGGLSGRAYWISGKSGQGKTSIAWLIAREVADDYAVIELDAQDMSMDKLRQLDEMCRIAPLGRGQHMIIVNEAHGLSAKVTSKLQTVLELPHVQRNSTWVFTTTESGQKRLFDTRFDAMPFLSRCVRLELTWEESVEAFAVKAQQIAKTEGLDGRPIEEYMNLAWNHQCNLRSMIQVIESGGMME